MPEQHYVLVGCGVGVEVLKYADEEKGHVIFGQEDLCHASSRHAQCTVSEK